MSDEAALESELLGIATASRLLRRKLIGGRAAVSELVTGGFLAALPSALKESGPFSDLMKTEVRWLAPSYPKYRLAV